MALIAVAPKHTAKIAPRGAPGKPCARTSRRSPRFCTRLRREAQVLARFNHTNIATLGAMLVNGDGILNPHRAHTRRESPDHLVATMFEP